MRSQTDGLVFINRIEDHDPTPGTKVIGGVDTFVGIVSIYRRQSDFNGIVLRIEKRGIQMQLGLLAIASTILAVASYSVFPIAIITAIGDVIKPRPHYSYVVTPRFVLLGVVRGKKHVMVLKLGFVKNIAFIVITEMSGQIEAVSQTKPNHLSVVIELVDTKARDKYHFAYLRFTGNHKRQKSKQKTYGFLFHISTSLDSIDSSVERASSIEEDCSSKEVSSSEEEWFGRYL